MEPSLQESLLTASRMEKPGTVKPDVVFFEQFLPAEFEEKEKKVLEADLMLVIGTSLCGTLLKTATSSKKGGSSGTSQYEKSRRYR